MYFTNTGQYFSATISIGFKNHKIICNIRPYKKYDSSSVIHYTFSPVPRIYGSTFLGLKTLSLQIWTIFRSKQPISPIFPLYIMSNWKNNFVYNALSLIPTDVEQYLTDTTEHNIPVEQKSPDIC